MPSPHTAVILAAGQGRRLQEILADRPKGMLQIGEKSIIRQSLDRLLRHGIQSVIMVIGYRAEDYQQALSADYPMIRFLHNPDFATTGSMHSLYLAKSAINADFLLLESDLVYEDRCLSTLLGDERTDLVLLSGFTGSGDEVYVYGQAGRIDKISKQPDTDLTCQGELVGISCLSLGWYHRMCDYYEREIDFNRDFHYEECISDLAATTDIHYHQVADLVWTEIDNPTHYRRALEEIYPKILAAADPTHN